MYVHPTLEEFFVRYGTKLTPINKKGCIVWTGAKDHAGRPRFIYYLGKDRVTTSVQRYVHFLFTRRELNGKEQVVSTCGVELCCNPFHLGVAKRTRTQSLEEAAAACAKRQAPLAPLNPRRHLNKRKRREAP